MCGVRCQSLGLFAVLITEAGTEACGVGGEEKGMSNKICDDALSPLTAGVVGGLELEGQSH